MKSMIFSKREHPLVFVMTVAIITLSFWQSDALAQARGSWPGYDFAGIPCDGKHMDYGPYDYTNPMHKKEKLPIVEIYHFTTKIEGGAGMDEKVVGDIDYTIRAFPNHHRALYAMVRHQLRFERKVGSERYAAMECYFQRASAFAPDDIKVYQLYAYYLNKLEKYDLVAQQYEKALAVAPNPLLHYKLGEAYLKTQNYAKAQEHAKAALAGGYEKADLKVALQKSGHWSGS